MKALNPFLLLGYCFLSVVAAVAPALAENSSATKDNKEPEKLPLTFGGYIDAQYAYDLNDPSNRDRAYTTQPARTNEFNINLAYLDAKLDADRIRGRLALQVGTSVQSNYSSEPTQGIVSGPSLSRHIQEGVIGYRVTDKLWIDGGIYFSHIGFESWISKENWTPSRSLSADYSPYYQSGLKATYQWTETLSTQLHLLNGWQNISENNGAKALGIQVAFSPSQALSITYNNFLGNEVGSQWRFFNDLIVKVGITDRLSVAALYDFGLQQDSGLASWSLWHVAGAFVRYQFTPTLALAARGEFFLDRNQVIVVTGTPNGFQTFGASMNADVALHKHLLWRTEFRGFRSVDAVYPTRGANSPLDGFVSSSLSLWF